jgi:hypothetical protein
VHVNTSTSTDLGRDSISTAAQEVAAADAAGVAEANQDPEQAAQRAGGVARDAPVGPRAT